MIRFVNAKINLGLNVLRRRPDGYHDLDTVFYPAGIYAGTPSDSGRLCDVLEITASGHDSMNVEGHELDCNVKDNLVWKALELFKRRYVDDFHVKITLYKNLPSQAGLGGGSADASFTLLMLNELTDNRFSESELVNMAAELGADCPFFILNRPCLAQGIGERLTPIDLDLSGYWLAVLKPDVNISTAEAFSYVVPGEPQIPVTDIVSRPICEWRSFLYNDFEKSMFRLYPSIMGIKEHLYAHGALYASMSGSGSAFYGIFSSEAEARGAILSADVAYSTVVRL